MVTRRDLPSSPDDLDMKEQANPGYGIPSQDPEAGAQAPIDAQMAAREAGSALAGGGMVAGAVAGTAIGAAVAGPVGMVVGAAAGAVAGVLGGQAAGTAVASSDADAGRTAHVVPPAQFAADPAIAPVGHDRLERVRRTAYEQAERRGFAPGQDVDDWLQAERIVDGTQPAP